MVDQHGMHEHGQSDSPSGVSRRQLLTGGGLLLGTLLAGGCGSNAGVRTGRVRYDPDSVTTSFDTTPGPVAAAPVWTPNPTPMYPVAPTQPPPAPAAPVSGIIARSSWTRAGVARPREIFAIGGVSRITVHHDGMPPANLRSMREVAARLEQIRQAHVFGRGWADIGYHYVIDPQGRIWEGRNAFYQGAHVKDQNENNLGILVLGNFEVQRPSSAAIATLDRFVVSQMQRYGVRLNNLRTHREMAQTECPGDNLQSYMVRSRGGGGVIALAAGRSGLGRG